MTVAVWCPERHAFEPEEIIDLRCPRCYRELCGERPFTLNLLQVVGAKVLT